MIVDLRRRAHLGDDAVLHQDDVVGDRHGLALVVGDIDRRNPEGLLDPANLRPHLYPQLRVQVAQRLVKQKDARLHHQGPGQGDPLLLAAGKLVGHALLHVAQLHQPEDVGHLFPDLLPAELPELQPVGHVVEHVVMGKQRVALKDHGRIPLVGGQLVNGLVPEIDFPLVRGFKAGDHPQRRGLSAAGGPQQRHEAARFNVQIHVVNRVKILSGLRVLINLADMTQPDALGRLISVSAHVDSTSLTFRLVPKCLMIKFIRTTDP